MKKDELEKQLHSSYEEIYKVRKELEEAKKIINQYEKERADNEQLKKELAEAFKKSYLGELIRGMINEEIEKYDFVREESYGCDCGYPL